MRVLENTAPIPSAVAGVPAIQDDDSVAGSEEEMPHAAMPAAAEVAAEEVRAEAPAQVVGPAQPSVTSGGSIASGESVAAEDLPRAVLGQPLRPVRGRCDMNWSYNDRVMVRCNNPAHEGCLKTRSVELCSTQFGRMAPVFFLGAWLKRSDMSLAEHKKYKPSIAEMRAFAADFSS